jgi:hypothetical protein
MNDEGLCDVCGKEPFDCDHLFARFDWTFGYCDEGYCARKRWLELDQEVEKVFLRALEREEPALTFWANDATQALWDEAFADYKPGSKSIGVGGNTMMTLVTELLEGMGLDKIDVPEDDEAGTGMSSVRTMFFAADHEKTFSQLKDELRSHLEQLWAVMQDEPPKPPVLKKPAKPAKKKAVAAKKKQPSTRGKRR